MKGVCIMAKPKKPKDPPKRKKQTAAKAKRQQRKQQSKAARKQQRLKQQQYRKNAKAKKQSSFSGIVSGLIGGIQSSSGGLASSALFTDRPRSKKKASPLQDIQKELKKERSLQDIQKDIEKERKKQERAQKVKLGKGTRKLDDEQYKKQRIANIKSKTDGRMNDIINKLNELSDDIDRILSNLPPDIARQIAPPLSAGKHYEIYEFYHYSYEDEIIGDAVKTLEENYSDANYILDRLAELLQQYEEYKDELQQAIDDLDSAIANVRQSGVLKNKFASPEQISAHYQELSQKQMQAAKELGLDVD